MNTGLRSLSAGMVALGLILLGVVIGSTLLPLQATPANSTRLAFVGEDSPLTETERTFAEVYMRIAPSVVSLVVTYPQTSRSLANASSSGSGFVVDLNGHIVTNFHVVEGASRIEVTMFDGTIARAEIVGLDADSDIAVVKIDVPQDRLFPVTFADSDALLVGQTTLAIGNPFNNNWTLTSGIVSAINRRIIGLNNYSIGGVIQTDAAINPGNSGGPLLNVRGEVIGVNSQIESQTRSNSGIGFAVPSNLVVKVAENLVNEGKMRYSFLGISSRPIDLDLVEGYGLPNNIRGVAIRQAQSGAPASLAGLRSISQQSVDIITAVNGTPVKDFDELIGWLAIHTMPGETVQLTVYRSGEVLTVPVILTERPNTR